MEERLVYSSLTVGLIKLFFFFVVQGLELRAYTLSHSISPFLVMGAFKIGSHELFSLAGFEH
jgi:hypothetical protein